MFFVFKQQTAYEMRISDWSSDVCSSDLNRIKGRAASACVFHCVGTLHASPVVHAAKVDSTPFVMLDVNLDNALDFREGLQDSGEIYPALKQLSKYARKVVTADDLPLAVRKSVISASTGRPGPSVLALG